MAQQIFQIIFKSKLQPKAQTIVLPTSTIPSLVSRTTRRHSERTSTTFTQNFGSRTRAKHTRLGIFKSLLGGSSRTKVMRELGWMRSGGFLGCLLTSMMRLLCLWEALMLGTLVILVCVTLQSSNCFRSGILLFSSSQELKAFFTVSRLSVLGILLDTAHRNELFSDYGRLPQSCYLLFKHRPISLQIIRSIYLFPHPRIKPAWLRRCDIKASEAAVSNPTNCITNDAPLKW